MDNTAKFWIIVAIIAVVVTGILSAFWYTNDHIVTATITDKERDDTGDGAGKYLIFTETEDGEVLVLGNYDNLFRGKFNSSDIYGDLKIGSTYEFTVIGYRKPALNEYENIISYELVKETSSDVVVSGTSTTLPDENQDLVQELNQKVLSGYTIKMDVDGITYDASNTEEFTFTEEMVNKYDIIVDYSDKIIVLELK